MRGARRAEVTDEALMTRYQRGELSAFSALVARHKTPLFNFVLRLVRSPSLAEDLVQDIFVRIIENASSFKHEALFTTWAYTIARNLCLDQIRKNRFRQHAPLDHHDGREASDGLSVSEKTADPHPRASAERGAVAGEIRAAVATAVDALPPDQKEVFLLREIAHLPFNEIATITLAQENTVKSRMRYALEHLQEALADFEQFARELR